MMKYYPSSLKIGLITFVVVSLGALSSYLNLCGRSPSVEPLLRAQDNRSWELIAPQVRQAIALSTGKTVQTLDDAEAVAQAALLRKSGDRWDKDMQADVQQNFNDNAATLYNLFTKMGLTTDLTLSSKGDILDPSEVLEHPDTAIVVFGCAYGGFKKRLEHVRQLALLIKPGFEPRVYLLGSDRPLNNMEREQLVQELGETEAARINTEADALAHAWASMNMDSGGHWKEVIVCTSHGTTDSQGVVRRATTDDTITDVAHRLQQAGIKRALFVSHQPYVQRQLLVADRVLDKHHSKLDMLVGSGSGMSPEGFTMMALDEFARTIHEIWLRAQRTTK